MREIPIKSTTSGIIVNTVGDRCFACNDLAVRIDIKNGSGKFAVPIFEVTDDQKKNILDEFEKLDGETIVFSNGDHIGVMKGPKFSWSELE